MKKKIFFVINPASGSNRKMQTHLPGWIEAYLPDHFSYEIHYTEYAGHARKMAEEVVKRDDISVLAVAGGDGSINEVLPVIVHSHVALAILPVGSGNGLARHLGYPMNIKKVLRNFDAGRVEMVDVAKSGQLLFCSNAGAGFDGFIAKSFSNHARRGFWGYAFSIVRHLFFYKPFVYELISEKETRTGEAFMITFFNSNQHGFNVKMAKEASVTDGLLEVYIVHKFPKWLAPFYVVAIFLGWHKRYKGIIHCQGKKFSLRMNQATDFHIDGEEVGKVDSVDIESIPLSLKVLIPHG